MAQIFVAKLHCESHMHKVFEGTSKLNQILDTLATEIKDGLTVTRDDIYTKHDDETYSYSATYSISGVEYLDSPRKAVAANLFKESVIFYNDFDDDGNLRTYTAPNIEVISFYFDIYSEYLCFYIKRRFNTDEITTAMALLFNKACEDFEYIFTVDLVRKGFSIDSFKEELIKMKKVEEIKITIRTPNPNSEILDYIMEENGAYLESMREGNLTQTSIVLTSKAPGGMKVTSPAVVKEIDRVSTIHNKISSEQAVENNYIIVDAISKDRSISTKDTKPLRRQIDDSKRSIFGVIEAGIDIIRTLI